MGKVIEHKIVFFALDDEIELNFIQNHVSVEAISIPSELGFVGVGTQVDHLVDRRRDSDIL